MVDILYGLVITLILGSYAFTWRMCAAIWKSVNKLRDNDIRHIEERLDKLEAR